ncbi:hypothetical protein [Herbidospora mongoliensis]|uniref:hypothetical protein n=1 Tax=Herbidospora mongoliensis TaxID=688067 RepID=UPI000A004032|nr:hypothetical protein [Herbidospora mongoliensis]
MITLPATDLGARRRLTVGDPRARSPHVSCGAALLDLRGHPQMIIRFGYGPPVPRAPRRPATELEIHHA